MFGNFTALPRKHGIRFHASPPLPFLVGANSVPILACPAGHAMPRMLSMLSSIIWIRGLFQPIA